MTSPTEHPDHEAIKASDVRFFWIQDGDPNENRLYHWCVDCAWVAVAVWHGGRLVSSEAPPPGARDGAWVRKTLEEILEVPASYADGIDSPSGGTIPERWLCEVCRQYIPRPVAVLLPADEEPCQKCGCSREMHILCRSWFDRGCGMAWTDCVVDDDGHVLQVGLLHCPCDGYTPPTGGRPITSTEFYAARLDEKARIDLKA